MQNRDYFHQGSYTPNSIYSNMPSPRSPAHFSAPPTPSLGPVLPPGFVPHHRSDSPAQKQSTGNHYSRQLTYGGWDHSAQRHFTRGSLVPRPVTVYASFNVYMNDRNDAQLPTKSSTPHVTSANDIAQVLPYAARSVAAAMEARQDELNAYIEHLHSKTISPRKGDIELSPCSDPLILSPTLSEMRLGMQKDHSASLSGTPTMISTPKPLVGLNLDEAASDVEVPGSPCLSSIELPVDTTEQPPKQQEESDKPQELATPTQGTPSHTPRVTIEDAPDTADLDGSFSTAGKEFLPADSDAAIETESSLIHFTPPSTRSNLPPEDSSHHCSTPSHLSSMLLSPFCDSRLDISSAPSSPSYTPLELGMTQPLPGIQERSDTDRSGWDLVSPSVKGEGFETFIGTVRKGLDNYLLVCWVLRKSFNLSDNHVIVSSQRQA
jgi:hypothetical protein